MSEKKDHFAYKAKEYETEIRRTNNVLNIADGIKDKIVFKNTDHIIDFGSGTGLLTQEFAPYVKKITAIDMSKSMTEILRAKENSFKCELEIKEIDIITYKTNNKYDGIISSMTIHHIEDIEKLFKQFYSILNDGGAIGLADLETEDGSFHSVDTGVFHFGFDKDEFLQIASKVGFKNLKIQTISVVEKPYGKFPIFLLTGVK